jgi:hypothetical protein
MAPPKKLPQTLEEAKSQGLHPISDFFLRKRAGKPKKKGNLASDAATFTTKKRDLAPCQ